MSEDKEKFVELMAGELKEIKAGTPYEKPSLIDFESVAAGCTNGLAGCNAGGGCKNGAGCTSGGVAAEEELS